MAWSMAWVAHALSLGASGATAPDDIAFLSLIDGYWQVCTMSADGSHRRQITRDASDKTRASWYPDGQYILVNGIDGHIYKVDIAKGTAAQISTSVQGYLDAVLSPDGQLIAFSLSTSGSVDGHDIWLMKADGSEIQSLVVMPRLQHEPAWSRDGHFVYFLSGDGGQSHDIWRVGLADRTTEQLTANDLYHFDIGVAADGALAFSSNHTGHYEIWAKPSAGDSFQITQDDAFAARPSWSSNGQHIVYESSRNGAIGIWVIDAKGGDSRLLTDRQIPSRFPVWRTAMGAR